MVMVLIDFKALADETLTQKERIKNFTKGVSTNTLRETLDMVIKLYVTRNHLDSAEQDTLLRLHAACFDQLQLDKIDKSKRFFKEEIDKLINTYLENFKKILAENNLLASEVKKPTAPIITQTKPILYQPNIKIHNLTSAWKYYGEFIDLNKSISDEAKFSSLSATINPWLDVMLIEHASRRLEAIPHHKYGNLLVNSIYSAVTATDYEQTMQILMRFNLYQSVLPHIYDILKTKMQNDPNFADQFNADSRYAPILAYHNTQIGREFPTVKNKSIDREFESELVSQELEIERATANDLQQDIINVGLFLRDNQKVQEQLLKLEKILENRAEELSLLDPNHKTLAQNTIDNPNKNKKFLSNYFKEWLSDNNFQYTKLDKDLSGQEFHSMLTKLTLFKDKQFGQQDHGEWTHLIQWWCVIEANRSNPFLKNTPQDLYRWVGTQKDEIWAFTFEDAGVKSKFNPFDFRTVTTLSKYLISAEFGKTCPLLQQLIASRVQKRETQQSMLTIKKS